MASVCNQENLVAALKLTPEEGLLILCTRLHLSQDQGDELNYILTGSLHWDQLL